MDKQIPRRCEQGWLSELATPLQARMQRLRREQARLTSLLGLQLLTRAAATLNLSGFALNQLDYPERGKPRWQAPLDFNISHSHQLVACAATTACRIGVDVERIREYLPAVPKRMFDESEQQRVKETPQAFFHIWTAKEAVVKVGGEGIRVMRHVHTRSSHATLGEDTLHLQPLDLIGGYCAHLASDTPVGEVHVEMLPLAELCNMTDHAYSTQDTEPSHRP